MAQYTSKTRLVFSSYQPTAIRTKVLHFFQFGGFAKPIKILMHAGLGNGCMTDSNTVAFTTTFTTSLDSPAATNVTAEPVLLKKACPVCGGSGRISLNRLPLVNLMNKSFTAGQQIELPNLSPIGADSPWDTSNPLDT